MGFGPSDEEADMNGAGLWETELLGVWETLRISGVKIHFE